MIAAYIPTPAEAGKLADGGLGNAFNGAWQKQVSDAAKRNGGLGNAEDGYLAWSKKGFVRFRNPGMTPEQNRRLAEISLTMGAPVDKMPSRWTLQNGERTWEKKGHDDGINKFIGSYDKQLPEFLNGTKKGITLKDSRRRFVLKMDEKAGLPVSYNYKKKGGLSGFFSKNLKFIQPIINVAGAVLAPFTGGASLAISGIASAASNAIAAGKLGFKNVVNAVGGALAPITGGLSSLAAGVVNGIKDGSLKARNLLASAASAIGGRLGLSGTEQAFANTGANVAGELIDTGRVSAQTVFNGIAPAITGLPGGAATDQLVQNGLGLAAQAIDGGRISATQIGAAISPLIQNLGVDPSTQGLLNGGLNVIAGAIDNGQVSARDIAGVVTPLFQGSANAGLINGAIDLAAGAIDNRRVSATDIINLATPILTELFGTPNNPAEGLPEGVLV